jgi:hypothetical protein
MRPRHRWRSRRSGSRRRGHIGKKKKNDKIENQIKMIKLQNTKKNGVGELGKTFFHLKIEFLFFFYNK